MATNMVKTPANEIRVTLASVTAGAPIAVGQLPGVALTASETTTNYVTMKTDGIFMLPVLGPVAPGGLLYLATGALSTVATGVRFGYALDNIAGATTPTIRVKVGY